MRLERRVYLWIRNLRRRLRKLERPSPPPVEPRLGLSYPDYVTCPHCGELEVEVWSHERTARCHNCGQTFDYPPPLKNQPGQPGKPPE